MSTEVKMARWINENRPVFIDILKLPVVKDSVVKSAKSFLTDREYEDILSARSSNGVDKD